MGSLELCMLSKVARGLRAILLLLPGCCDDRLCRHPLCDCFARINLVAILITFWGGDGKRKQGWHRLSDQLKRLLLFLGNINSGLDWIVSWKC